MIPHFLHWVWPHDCAMPPDDAAALRSWHDHHPAWRHLIWTSRPDAASASLLDRDYEVRPLPLLVNHRLYSLLGCHSDRAQSEGFPHQARAMVASVEIMARYGGVCPPLGEHCVGNIEALLENVRLFTRDAMALDGPAHEVASRDASPHGDKTRGVLQGATLPLYGATSNHPALWNVVRDLKNSVVAGRDLVGALSAASLAELLQFRLGRHPDWVAFPAAAFEEGICSTL